MFFEHCLELNSEGSLLEIYTGAWAKIGGKGVFSTIGLYAIPIEHGLIKVCDGNPQTSEAEALR